jgi:excisionase family DNA binding protein
MADEQGRRFSEADRRRLAAVLGGAPPRYLSVREAARASGLSKQSVYRAVDRGELAGNLVCSRLRIHPADFLAWIDGDRAAPREQPRTAPRIGSRKVPAPNGLRGLLQEGNPAS